MTYALGARSIGNLAGVHANLIEIVKIAISLTTQDFGVAGKAVRTAAEQNALFVRGVTQKDGYRSKSNHQPWDDGLGHAVDLTPYAGGFIVDDRAWPMYPAIASAMSLAARRIGLVTRLTWGCDWGRPMSEYGSAPSDMTAAMAHYKNAHPGRDFTDGPHFQLS